MTTFVLVPGMNHGGWWYEPLVEALGEHGHRGIPVTPTGLEPRPELGAAVNLDTHLADVVDAVDALDDAGVSTGDDVALVGHSYGGLLITGAADQRADRVGALVYLDAFLPQDGESAWWSTNDEERRWYVDDSRQSGHSVQPLPFFDERARPHPVATLHQALHLTGAWRAVPTKVYVEATDWPFPSPMGFHAERARASDEFVVHRWDTRHNVMHDGPQRVLDLLLDLEVGRRPT